LAQPGDRAPQVVGSGGRGAGSTASIAKSGDPPSGDGQARHPGHESVLHRFERMLAQIRQGACIPERTSLMGELMGLLHSPECPEPLRRRGLEVVGRLARREVCEPACQSGLDKMRSRARSRGTG
jgi:hypothetical protein